MPLLDQHGLPLPPTMRTYVPPQAELPGLNRPRSTMADSYANFMASVGYGTQNLQSGSTYGFNPITRERTLLEWCYRGSWICGVVIDAVGDDMTKMGVDFRKVPPDESEELEHAMQRLCLWQQLNELIKWGRLYGGAIAVIEIDGQDPSTPLRTEAIAKGSYRGISVMDRWMVEPSLNDLVRADESACDKGMPRYYRVTADAPAYPRHNVHYTRCFRYEGFSLPYWQRISENMWGMSVYERFWDRLIAFDSVTQGSAQLAYKAYLRWIKIKDLRTMISAGGQNMQRLLNQINIMRQFQSNEGISLLDADDEFGTTTYSFDGLSDLIISIGQQLSGAVQIPLVRLFGQSPAGLNATGESDLRTYYDGIHQQQEGRLRRPLDVMIAVIAKSEGIPMPDDWYYEFEPLWQLTDKEKADMAEVVTRTVLSAQETGAVSQRRALEELRRSAQHSGIWSTITDEEIDQAEDMPPEPVMPGMPGQAQPAQPGQMGRGSEQGGEHPELPGQPPGGAPAERNPQLRTVPGGGAQPAAAPKPRLPVPIPRVHLGGGGGGG